MCGDKQLFGDGWFYYMQPTKKRVSHLLHFPLLSFSFSCILFRSSYPISFFSFSSFLFLYLPPIVTIVSSFVGQENHLPAHAITIRNQEQWHVQGEGNHLRLLQQSLLLLQKKVGQGLLKVFLFFHINLHNLKPNKQMFVG